LVPLLLLPQYNYGKDSNTPYMKPISSWFAGAIAVYCILAAFSAWADPAPCSGWVFYGYLDSDTQRLLPVVVLKKLTGDSQAVPEPNDILVVKANPLSLFAQPPAQGSQPSSTVVCSLRADQRLLVTDVRLVPGNLPAGNNVGVKNRAIWINVHL
jgi:hypothetical protein